jgi:hypothetical protein
MNEMVIRADARAIGAITALGAPMRRKPNTSDYRTGNRASDCISYRLDNDGNMVNATIFRATRTRKPNRRSDVVAPTTSDIDLMAKMGTIHAQNDI